MYMHVYMYTCLVSHHEQLTLIGQSKISKCGSKPLAITGWPGAENNTRAGPTAAWIMGFTSKGTWAWLGLALQT